MKALRLLACLALLMIFTAKVSAEEKGVIFGKGTTSCKEYAKKSLPKKNDFVIWAQGYLSAYNSIAPDTRNVLGEKDFYWMLEQFDQFCRANSESRFNDAVVDLLQRLHPQGIAVNQDPGMAISIKDDSSRKVK